MSKFTEKLKLTKLPNDSREVYILKGPAKYMDQPDNPVLRELLTGEDGILIFDSEAVYENANFDREQTIKYMKKRMEDAGIQCFIKEIVKEDNREFFGFRIRKGKMTTHYKVAVPYTAQDPSKALAIFPNHNFFAFPSSEKSIADFEQMEGDASKMEAASRICVFYDSILKQIRVSGTEGTQELIQERFKL